MSYKKAQDVLPQDLLQAIQSYIDGEYLYIPRKEENRKAWGESKKSRQSIAARNKEIVSLRGQGASLSQLAGLYYLSEKTISAIISKNR